MLALSRYKKAAVISILAVALSSCYQPPYNRFKPYYHTPRTTATGATVGTITGAAAGSVAIGAGAGVVAGGLVGLYKDSKKGVINTLQSQDIQVVEYGNTVTLIVPTDKYFLVNTPRFNKLNNYGLNNIVKLLKLYPRTPIYVAGFTDDVGSRERKIKMSQAQAETMITYLWANDIPARLLQAEGYGDKYPVSDNKLTHGSAQNRRLEIQWFSAPVEAPTSIIRSMWKQ